MSLRPTPATNESAGPFRKVVGTEERSETYPARTYGSNTFPPYTRTWTVEMLECGHPGKLASPYGLGQKASMLGLSMTGAMFNEEEWYPVWVPARDADGATLAELPDEDWQFVKQAYNDFVRAQAIIRKAIERADVPLDA